MIRVAFEETTAALGIGASCENWLGLTASTAIGPQLLPYSESLETAQMWERGIWMLTGVPARSSPLPPVPLLAAGPRSSKLNPCAPRVHLHVQPVHLHTSRLPSQASPELLTCQCRACAHLDRSIAHLTKRLLGRSLPPCRAHPVQLHVHPVHMHTRRSHAPVQLHASTVHVHAYRLAGPRRPGFPPTGTVHLHTLADHLHAPRSQ